MGAFQDELNKWLKEKTLKKYRIFPTRFDVLFYAGNEFLIRHTGIYQYTLKKNPILSSEEFYDLSNELIDYFYVLYQSAKIIRREDDFDTGEEYLVFEVFDPIGNCIEKAEEKYNKIKPKTYGYCRISRPQQSIDRQIRNIKAAYPDAIILQEAYTGTKMERPEWTKLHKKVKSGDAIVFDSVSRMSRNADEGVQTYFELYEKGIQLIFLKEHYIDTTVYADNMRDKIELQGTDEDEIFKGLNNYFRKLAEKQIRIAFDQAEKEVQDLHQRTKEGIETARLNGKQIGQRPGNKLHIKKAAPAKELIKKHSRDFGGSLKDVEVMKLTGLARNTYYKYKRELKDDKF